jgi:uncharacterized membrane protein
MRALPTLGGNNGQASAINNRGQIVGISETTVPDSGCPSSKPGKIISPVLWEKGEVRSLPTVAGDPDGFVQGINDRGRRRPSETAQHSDSRRIVGKRPPPVR